MDYKKLKEKLKDEGWRYIRVKNSNGVTICGFNVGKSQVSWEKIESAIKRHAPDTFHFELRETAQGKSQPLELYIEKVESDPIKETIVQKQGLSDDVINELRELERLRITNEQQKIRLEMLENLNAELHKKIEELEISASQVELEDEEEEASVTDILLASIAPQLIEKAPQLLDGLISKLNGNKNKPQHEQHKEPFSTHHQAQTYESEEHEGTFNHNQ